MAKIDNDKMWMSLIQLLQDSSYPSIRQIGYGLNDAFKNVSNKSFKIEAGKFYMCIKDFVIGGLERFCKGDLYKSEVGECVTDKNGFQYNSFASNPAEYFRPATEEEIAKAHPEWNAPVTDNYDKIKQAEQDTSELTEFEKAIDECVYDFFLHNSQEFSLEDCVNKHKDAILKAARKQIASEISIETFCSNIGYVNGNMNNAYRKGAADMLNKIKEG